MSGELVVYQIVEYHMVFWHKFDHNIVWDVFVKFNLKLIKSYR